MEIISNPTQDEIKKAAQALKDGQLVAFPTETVYGLGADATNEKAVSRVYSVKARPTDHPLIVHISSINQLGKWAIEIPDFAIKLAKNYWPGPMTLILSRKAIAKDFITGGQDSVGVRVPNQSIALELIHKFELLGGYGIAAPSANRFRAVSPTTAQAVYEELGTHLTRNDLILDGGHSEIGIESTIIDCTGITPRVLRPGAISKKMIESITGLSTALNYEPGITRTSGMLDSHYSPKAKVRIGLDPKPGEGLIALSNIPTPRGVVRLGLLKNNEDFAREIYQLLRLGDNKGLKYISIILPPAGYLSEAIADRMNKAAAG